MVNMGIPSHCAPGENKCKETRGENPYGSRVLVHNWYEDRRQFHQYCTRCTGPSLYRTDYLAHHAEDYGNKKCMPPIEYEAKRKAEGSGSDLLRNPWDYCEYMQNYTTTYDLMHNWELRRAGCKPKPTRKWLLGADALWFPQPDNALSFGNLTQLGFRQAPQLPMVPNDWKTYNMDTTYKHNFGPPRYPDGYVLCRYATPKSVSREIADMALVRKPGLCDSCPYYIPKDGRDNDVCRYLSCDNGKMYSYIPNVPRAHPTLVPGHTLKSKLPVQTLFPNSTGNYEQIKRPPHPAPVRGEPIYESTCGHSCDNKELCAQAQQAREYNQGPYLKI